METRTAFQHAAKTGTWKDLYLYRVVLVTRPLRLSKKEKKCNRSEKRLQWSLNWFWIVPPGGRSCHNNCRTSRRRGWAPAEGPGRHVTSLPMTEFSLIYQYTEIDFDFTLVIGSLVGSLKGKEGFFLNILEPGWVWVKLDRSRNGFGVLTSLMIT